MEAVETTDFQDKESKSTVCVKTIGQRIKTALYEKRMTGYELSSKAQISEGGLSQIINGKIKNLKIDTALKIANALDLSVLWLITGEHTDADSENSLNGTSSAITEVNSDYIQVPRFEVSFNPQTDLSPKFTEFKYDRVFTFHKSYFEKYTVKHPNLCRSFKVTGDGMEPMIRRGDYIIVDCDPDLTVADGDIYAFCDAHGLHVKRLITPLRGGLIIRADNKLYEDEFLSEEETKSIRIIGHVIDRAGSLMGA